MSSRPLCREGEIAPGEARGFTLELDGQPLSLLLVNHDGTLHAYRNRCPHTGVELNWQPDQFLDLEGTHIQCSLHGALFRIEDGYCLYGPCSGDSLQPLKLEHIDGMIAVSLEDG